MKKIQRLFILALIVASCSDKPKNVNAIVDTTAERQAVSRADKIAITFFNEGDTLKTSVTGETLLATYGKQIWREEPQPLPACKPIGSLHFYKEDSVIYAVGFSTKLLGGGEGCQYMLLKGKGWKFSESAVSYLDDLYYELRTKKENERRNQN